MRVCRDCNAPLPKHKRAGRPRVVCQACSETARYERNKKRWAARKSIYNARKRAKRKENTV